MTESPLILAIETSSDVCGVAVTRGPDVISAHTFRHRMHLSERLIDHVDRVLAEAGADLNAVDVFATGIGPGSFTGVRIGVMTTKTFADVQAKPLYGVRSLDAIASRYVGSGIERVVVILPCRAETVYCGLFETDPDVTPMGEPETISVEQAIERAQEPGRVVVCGQAAARFRDRLTAAGLAVGSADDPSAIEIARMVWRRMEAGVPPDDPFTVTPLYMAPPPITMPKDRRGLVSGPAGRGDA